MLLIRLIGISYSKYLGLEVLASFLYIGFHIYYIVVDPVCLSMTLKVLISHVDET